MANKKILGLSILVWYICSQLLSYFGFVQRDQVFAKDENKNTLTQLVAVLVDEKLYPSISKDLERYATSYIQAKYHNSKALVMPINTQEYTAPEITKLLENLYFDGQKDTSSQLIGVILVGDIPLPVVQYKDFIFPSIYPYVDFLDQKYLWNESQGYFIQEKDKGQAELWHGIINFKSEPQQYINFFSKLKTYTENPSNFTEKKIWYDDFIAQQNNFLEEVLPLYLNKLIFAEDLSYSRLTDLLFNTLQWNNTESNQQLLQDLSASLKNLGAENQIANTPNINLETKTPTKFLNQKLESLIKEYSTTLSTNFQRTINENIAASDRWDNADTHYQKLQIKDQLILGDKETLGIFRGINDKLEEFVDQKIATEKYAMKSIIPILYQTEKFYRKKILIKNFYLPDYQDTFKFYYFGKDAETLQSAEESSIYRGTFRNLSQLGTYSSIINDTNNPAKSTQEDTQLQAKSLWASYDVFSTQVEANRGYNMLETQKEYELYQKEKTYAEFKYQCTKRRFWLKRKRIPCKKVERKWVGECDINNEKKQSGCENFEQFGKRVRGWATSLNLDMDKISENKYIFKRSFDPKSAWKSIFNIAGSVSLQTAQPSANSFEGLKVYSSPTQTQRKEGELKSATGHSVSLEKVNYFTLDIKNLKFTKEKSDQFSLFKAKKSRTDEQNYYKYKIIDSTIKHTATTAEQINGIKATKYGTGSEAENYTTTILANISIPTDNFSEPVSKTLTQLKNALTERQDFASKDQADTIAQNFSETIFSGAKEQFSNYTNLVITDYANQLSSAINGIINRQIENNPKIWLYSKQYQDILSKFPILVKTLQQQETITKQIFKNYQEVAEQFTQLNATIAQKIATAQEQLETLLKNPNGNSNEQQKRETILTTRKQAQTRILKIQSLFLEINKADECGSYHELLAGVLGKVEWNIIPSSTSAECNDLNKQEQSDVQGSSSNTNEISHFSESISIINETQKHFTTHFFSDPNNPEIEIPGMNELTPDRPIDSPRYVSFQGIWGHQIKLIYPNIFKAEAFNLSGDILSLKSPETIKKSLENYLQTKINEYNTILQNEKAQVNKRNDHYSNIAGVDPLATPTLTSKIRPYQPFSYQEFLNAIGGEKMLNTLAHLLYYQNVGIQTRAFSDNIKTDIENTRSAFDVNKKIQYIINNYLTQNNSKHYNTLNPIAQLVLPNYVEKGYEVWYINSSNNDSITSNNQTQELSISTAPKAQASEAATMALQQDMQQHEKECWFSYDEALLVFDIKKGNSPWLNGLKCWFKELVKTPAKLSLSRNDSFDFWNIFNEANGYKQSASILESSTLDKIKGTILENIQISLSTNKLQVGEGSGSIILQSFAPQGENLRVNVTTTGENCLIIEKKSTCNTKVSISGNGKAPGRKIPIKLGKTTTGIFQATLEVCGNKGNCGQKTYTLSATPQPIKTISVDYNPENTIAAGVYTLFEVRAFDQYKNQILKSFEPYILSTDKGGFVVGGELQKNMEITDFTSPIIYGSLPTDAGTVTFKVTKKTDNTTTVITQKQGVLLPVSFRLLHNGKENTQINYQINNLPATINNTPNPQKLIKVELQLIDNKNKPLTITTKATSKTKNKLVATLTLNPNTNKLETSSSFTLKNGKAEVYILPGTVAGEEELSFLIPGLAPKTFKISLLAGAPTQLKIQTNKTFATIGEKIQGTITLQDQRNNLIPWNTDIKLTATTPEKTSVNILQIKNGKTNITHTFEKQDTSLTLHTELLNSSVKLKDSQTIKLKQQFLSSAINSGLNVMYLNLFGSDRGNQRGYFSENNQYGENIIAKSEKTLAITTQLVDLKKIQKPALILGEQLYNYEKLPLQATLNKTQLTLSIQNIGEIKIRNPLQQIIFLQKESQLLTSLKNHKKASLILYNLDTKYNYRQGQLKLNEDPSTTLATRDNGLSLEPSENTVHNIPVRNLVWNWEIIAQAIFSQFNFGNIQSTINNNAYELARSFQQGSTNRQAIWLFNTNNLLQDTYEGYDSIQNSDQMEKYIGFRGDFRNITSFAAGKSVGEATIPFGSEFLINLGDPLLQRGDSNSPINNSEYNGDLGKTIYSDTNSSIFKVIDIDYNNDGLKDLLVVYENGIIKLQKQYQDKNFKNLEDLLITTEQIKEVYVGDADGNKYPDIFILNTKNQLRTYLNTNGSFDVDGKIACLNINTAEKEQSKTPSDLSGTHQLFIKDMDNDNKIDIVTYDTRGDIKITYGNSYLSTNPTQCDDQRYQRQEKSTKLVKNLWTFLNTTPIRDQSLIRREGLKVPDAANLSKETQDEANTLLSTAAFNNMLSSSTLSTKQIQNASNKIIADFTNQANALSTSTTNASLKYIENPFIDYAIDIDSTPREEQAYIPINQLSNDKIDVSKQYRGLNGSTLTKGSKVQVTVTISAKEKITNATFFDKVEWPRKIHTTSEGLPQNLNLISNSAKIHKGIEEYLYYLTDINLNPGEKLIISYPLEFINSASTHTIQIEDINILDYQFEPYVKKTTPQDWQASDLLPDIIVQPNNGCYKINTVLFNNKKENKRAYEEKDINLQELIDAYQKDAEKQREAAQKEAQQKIDAAQTNGLASIPGLESIGEKSPLKSYLDEIWSDVKNGGNLNLGNIKVFDKLNQKLEKTEQQISELANMACNGFSFGDKTQSCKGLPVPFNQAFLAPGNYHIMGCIPLEPLTKTLGKGVPVFHFPGTLYTPFGPIPIPWGLKGPSDQFLRAPNGTYPSLIRIYAAPTLTAQMGIAICMGPQSAGMSIPSPFADLGGNCIVTAVSLPCKGSSNGNNSEENSDELFAWTADYGNTNPCTSDIKNSPFKDSKGKALTLNLNTNLITSEENTTAANDNKALSDFQNAFTIPDINIGGVKHSQNKILGGLKKGIMQKVWQRLSDQIDYTKNNLLRRQFNLYFPDIEKMQSEIAILWEALQQSWQMDTAESSESQNTESTETGKEKSWSKIPKRIPKKETIFSLSIAEGDNPFIELQKLFNQSDLIKIRTENISVKVPFIYSEDIQAYINYLQTWLEAQKNMINTRTKHIETVILSCPVELTKLKTKWDSDLLQQKIQECKTAENIAQKLVKTSKQLEKTSEQIMQNVQTLQEYKKFPLELYEWLHITDKYMAEIAGVVNNFFSYINFRMEINATRFSQYVDAIITVIAVAKTYQILIDISLNRSNKCGKCTNDTYDQYTCKLSFLCPDLPLLPIPNIKIPNLTVDLSNIDIALDIVLPNFTFVPESIELPRLPNIPNPPQVGLNIDRNFDIPDVPQLPQPPVLPELPSLIPQVQLELPILPPAPKIPELPNQIQATLDLINKIGKIYCIIKQGFGLVGESSVKAKIEQMTQRTYDVPWVDHLDLTKFLNTSAKKLNLQGVDYQVDAYLNLQYNFDGFYTYLKGITDGLNSLTYAAKNAANQGSQRLTEKGMEGENRANEQIKKAEEVTNTNLKIDLSYQADKVIKDYQGDLMQNENTNSKQQLQTQLTEVVQKLDTPLDKEKFQSVLALTKHNTKITPNIKQTKEIKNQISELLNDHQDRYHNLAQLAKTDYNEFLLALDKHNTTNTNLQLTFGAPLLNENKEIKTLLTQNKVSDILVTTHEQQINGYLNSLNTHSADQLNMTTATYQKSKQYLTKLQNNIQNYYAIQTTNHQGSSQLITKSNQPVSKTLFTQNGTSSNTRETAPDYSSYVKGVLVKTKDKKSLINVVHSDYNVEKLQSFYQIDMNNDKKPDLISRDRSTVSIKYAEDATTTTSNKNKRYYLIKPNLKNKAQKYEKSNGDSFKLYDENPEVKNFMLRGQSFDSLSFSWDNDQSTTQDGYLIRISDRIDVHKEKFNTDQSFYILLLPNGTISEGKTLTINEKKVSIDSLHKQGILYTVQYYDTTQENLNFGISEVPRKRQYLQITSLGLEESNYIPNAPWSNQELGGRQIIADTTGPTPTVSLYRKTKKEIVDQGNQIEGWVGSYYDLIIDREDNLMIDTAKISSKNKVLKSVRIGKQKGETRLENLFFTWAQQLLYTIEAIDTEGNETQESINLTIQVPSIQIENISRFSGRKEWILNPVLISSSIDQEIDQGQVSFERKRNNLTTEIQAISKGQKTSTFPLTTDQTQITGAYYDFGNLIGLYNAKWTQLWTINAENGEIKIDPKYQKDHSLEISFTKHYPVIHLMNGNKKVFEMLLSPAELIKLTPHEGTLIPLEGKQFWVFAGGQALLINNQAMLYISPKGELSTNENLYGTYKFNPDTTTVIYSIKEHRFGKEIATVEFKTVPL